MTLKQLGLGVCLSLLLGETTTPSMYLEPLQTKPFPIAAPFLVFAIPGTYLDPRLIEIMSKIRQELEKLEGRNAAPLIFSTHHYGDSIDLVGDLEIVWLEPEGSTPVDRFFIEIDARTSRLKWILTTLQARGKLTYTEHDHEDQVYLTVSPLSIGNTTN
jgi:hypothetical protein